MALATGYFCMYCSCLKIVNFFKTEQNLDMTLRPISCQVVPAIGHPCGTILVTQSARLLQRSPVVGGGYSFVTWGPQIYEYRIV